MKRAFANVIFSGSFQFDAARAAVRDKIDGFFDVNDFSFGDFGHPENPVNTIITLDSQKGDCHIITGILVIMQVFFFKKGVVKNHGL